MVGLALAPIRDQLTIATKSGCLIDDQGNNKGLNSRPEVIKASVEGSRRCLKTYVIDLLCQHRLDPNVLRPDPRGQGAQLRALRGGSCDHSTSSCRAAGGIGHQRALVMDTRS